MGIPHETFGNKVSVTKQGIRTAYLSIVFDGQFFHPFLGQTDMTTYTRRLVAAKKHNQHYKISK